MRSERPTVSAVLLTQLHGSAMHYIQYTVCHMPLRLSILTTAAHDCHDGAFGDTYSERPELKEHKEYVTLRS